MSSRYGRNQRRAAREALAAKDREIARLGAVASEHYDRAMAHLRERMRVEDEMREWAARIVTLLGDDTAFAREIATKRIDADLFASVYAGAPLRGWIDKPVHPMRPGAPESLDLSRRIIQLFAIVAGCDVDAVQYRRRYIIRGPKGAYALMMDERTIYQLTRKGDAGLMRHLLEHIVKPWAEETGR